MNIHTKNAPWHLLSVYLSDFDYVSVYSKAIYVGAPDKSSGKRRQSIHICYDLIGFIPLSELMEQEMA